MSASSTADGPVQTVIDLLEGYASTDYPNGTKPDPIEKRWKSDQRTKGNRSDVAAYVWSSDVGTREVLGAEYDTTVQRETVSVEVWSTDESQANDVASDVIDIIEDFANDTRANTNWVTIRPTEVDDRRAETLARRADHYVQVVDVELMRDDDTGT